jgi:hypothetical protein
MIYINDFKERDFVDDNYLLISAGAYIQVPTLFYLLVPRHSFSRDIDRFMSVRYA